MPRPPRRRAAEPAAAIDSAPSTVDHDLDDGFIFRAFLEATPDSVYVKDRQARIRRASRTMARNLGVAGPDDLIGKSDTDLFGTEFGDRTRIEDLRVMDTDEPVSGLIESRQLADGGVNWTHTSKLPLHDESGQVVGLLGVTREINDLKQAEMNLHYLATHDPLTSLPNRYLMMDRLSRVLVRAKRDQKPFAVLFLDLDDFKTINDSAGHDAGDDVLRAVAGRLVAGIRASDTVARLGGDEFVLVLEETERVGAGNVADKIRAAVAEPIRRRRSTLMTTCSIGISLYPDHAGDAQALITAADYAMYLAKQHGKDRYEVCPDQDKAARSRSSTGPTRA